MLQQWWKQLWYWRSLQRSYDLNIKVLTSRFAQSVWSQLQVSQGWIARLYISLRNESFSSKTVRRPWCVFPSSETPLSSQQSSRTTSAPRMASKESVSLKNARKTSSAYFFHDQISISRSMRLFNCGKPIILIYNLLYRKTHCFEDSLIFRFPSSECGKTKTRQRRAIPIKITKWKKSCKINLHAGIYH